MTVCQFFLQGRCRFGQNCRFEHPYGDDRNNRNLVNSQQLDSVIKQIVDEVIAAEEGGQWPLSCFSPLKGGSNIEGWEDISPEEIRWKMYEARANGTLNQCNLEISQYYNNAKKMREIMKKPTMERVNLIVNALKGKGETSNSSSQFGTSVPSSSLFGNSNQSTLSQNIFKNSTLTTGSHGSIFGGSSPSTGNVFKGSVQSTESVFGNSSGFSSQNIFGGSNPTNSFSNNSFSGQQNSNQNLFLKSPSLVSGNIFLNSTSSNPNTNVFSSPNNSSNFQNQTNNNPIFGSNTTFFQNTGKQNPSIFCNSAKENIATDGNNIFNSQPKPNENIFGGTAPQNSCNLQTSKEFDSSIYSNIEDLNEEEIQCFVSTTFDFGKIPLKPPPKEYCK